ncbi:hypothetical protein TURU_064948 [Turdus rufiventris]|nr:hypothetical protein TURU_064948 [Turdus rufiventris]
MSLGGLPKPNFQALPPSTNATSKQNASINTKIILNKQCVHLQLTADSSSVLSSENKERGRKVDPRLDSQVCEMLRSSLRGEMGEVQAGPSINSAFLMPINLKIDESGIKNELNPNIDLDGRDRKNHPVSMA